MHRRLLRIPGLPLGGGVNLLLVGGAAYLAMQHDQGKHGRPHALCLVCWMDKIAPAPPAPAAEAPGEPGPADPPDQA
jgi:hypothetical protein